LYSGENLNTRYKWSSSLIPADDNIAYCQRTWTNSGFKWHYPYLFSGGMAVDGQRQPTSGLFLDSPLKNPKLLIDLHQARSIGTVKIFEGNYSSRHAVNRRPMVVAFSNDKSTWQSFSIYEKSLLIHLQFENSIRARYVLITASGESLLALDEVEIYPP